MTDTNTSKNTEGRSNTFMIFCCIIRNKKCVQSSLSEEELTILPKKQFHVSSGYVMTYFLIGCTCMCVHTHTTHDAQWKGLFHSKVQRCSDFNFFHYATQKDCSQMLHFCPLCEMMAQSYPPLLPQEHLFYCYCKWPYRSVQTCCFAKLISSPGSNSACCSNIQNYY